MDENRRTHLGYIQNIIARMGSNSFYVKGWSVTLVAALFALAAKDANKNYVLISCIPVPIFWVLDAYYLSLERKFRMLYKEVVAGRVADYVMDVSSYKSHNWTSCLFSISVWPVYALIILTTFCVMFLLQ